MKAHELPEAGKYCFLNKTILAEGHFCDTGWNPENGPSAGAAGVGWDAFREPLESRMTGMNMYTVPVLPDCSKAQIIPSDMAFRTAIPDVL